MPQGSFPWSAIAPFAISAKDGSVAERIELVQTVYGPGIVDPTGPRVPVTSLSRVVSEGRESDATYYQIDTGTIGVLRTIESSMNGMVVQSKIFSRYSLNGGTAPTPKPSKKPNPSNKPTPKKGNGGQGKNGGQGTTVKPTPNPKDGGQGKNGGQGSKAGGQGTVVKPTLPTEPKCKCEPTKPLPPTTEPVKPVPANPAPTVTIAVNPTETTKIKFHVKQVTVDNTVAGDSVTKTKIDEKVKTDGETGDLKIKSSFKQKESTPDSNSKLKVKIKIKVKGAKKSAPSQDDASAQE
jgi:hypothetical protein